MSESMVSVTEGSGKNLQTWDRTVSSVLVQGQFVLPGEYPYPTYAVVAQNVSVATSAAHVLQIMAGASKYVRIRRITIEQATSATAAGFMRFSLRRLTTAGSGGTAITPAPFDLSDAAAGATAQTLPSSKGTESTVIGTSYLVLRQAVSATGSVADDAPYVWEQHPSAKPIIIPAGTSNGFAIVVGTGVAGATVDAVVEFVETDYL